METQQPTPSSLGWKWLSHRFVKLHLDFSGDRSELRLRETRCDFVGFHISPGRLVAKLSFVFTGVDAKIRYRQKEEHLSQIFAEWNGVHCMLKCGRHNLAMFGYLSKFKSMVNPGLIDGWTFCIQMVRILLVIQVLCSFYFLGLYLEKIWQILSFF